MALPFDGGSGMAHLEACGLAVFTGLGTASVRSGMTTRGGGVPAMRCTLATWVYGNTARNTAHVRRYEALLTM